MLIISDGHMDWNTVLISAGITAAITAITFIPLEWAAIYTFIKLAFHIDPLAKSKGKEGLYLSMTNYNRYGRSIGGFEVSIDEIVGKASSTKTELELGALRKQYNALKLEHDILLMEKNHANKRKSEQNNHKTKGLL